MVQSIRRGRVAAVTVPICFVFLFFICIYKKSSRSPDHVDADLIAFIPNRPHPLLDCDDLFKSSSGSSFELTPEYHRRLPDFERAVNRTATGQKIEGFSGQQPTEYRALHYLASRPSVRYICETGFNLGHSTFSYLTANPSVIVHSFDLGEHDYAHAMAKYLSAQFPGRIFVHFGDSQKTVPSFAAANPDFRCDLMYVDGGHTYPVALADTLNLASLANMASGNIIVFDDYPTLKAFDRQFGWAWEDVRRWGFISEIMRCSFRNKQFQRGFVVGKVIRAPDARKLHALDITY